MSHFGVRNVRSRGGRFGLRFLKGARIERPQRQVVGLPVEGLFKPGRRLGEPAELIEEAGNFNGDRDLELRPLVRNAFDAPILENELFEQPRAVHHFRRLVVPADAFESQAGAVRGGNMIGRQG